MYNIALSEQSYEFLYNQATLFKEYICSLKDEFRKCILHRNRKTGKNISYILSFKLSEDLIEAFFSDIRSRGGFINNPNCRQFETSYKHLLIKNKFRASRYSNCLDETDENEIQILQIY